MLYTLNTQSPYFPVTGKKPTWKRSCQTSHRLQWQPGDRSWQYCVASMARSRIPISSAIKIFHDAWGLRVTITKFCWRRRHDYGLIVFLLYEGKYLTVPALISNRKPVLLHLQKTFSCVSPSSIIDCENAWAFCGNSPLTLSRTTIWWGDNWNPI